jgi:hypothetical protein
VYLCGRRRPAAFVLGALLHWKLYPIGFSKAQESGERWARGGAFVPTRAQAVLADSASCGASSCSRSCGCSSATRRSGRS